MGLAGVSELDGRHVRRRRPRRRSGHGTRLSRIPNRRVGRHHEGRLRRQRALGWGRRPRWAGRVHETRLHPVRRGGVGLRVADAGLRVRRLGHREGGGGARRRGRRRFAENASAARAPRVLRHCDGAHATQVAVGPVPRGRRLGRIQRNPVGRRLHRRVGVAAFVPRVRRRDAHRAPRLAREAAVQVGRHARLEGRLRGRLVQAHDPRDARVPRARHGPIRPQQPAGAPRLVCVRARGGPQRDEPPRADGFGHGLRPRLLRGRRGQRRDGRVVRPRSGRPLPDPRHRPRRRDGPALRRPHAPARGLFGDRRRRAPDAPDRRTALSSSSSSSERRRLRRSRRPVRHGRRRRAVQRHEHGDAASEVQRGRARRPARVRVRTRVCRRARGGCLR
mmetsp:Transcript_12192/g.49083  ORF Transcript_12192/g.49083 Transcript_12192/m.49083 type:complete len:391 (-) Transcript_12192:1295-2467(-)